MARWRSVVPPPGRGRDVELQPRQARHLHLGAQPQQAARDDLLDPPEVARLPDEQLLRVAPAPAQPRTADSRSNAPRTSQAQGSEYQPLSPPIDSTTSQTASGEAATTALRSSVNSEPPAQSGSVGIGSLGAPGM